MPLHDWISNYPGVRALLQRPGEVLDYAPEGVDPTRLYALVEHEVVAVRDICAWAQWLHEADRAVEETTVGGVVISTAFLAFDYYYSLDDPPLLFQTMVYGGRLHEVEAKYATWNEAVAGHAQMVALVQETERGNL